jgi:cytochrome c551/c552
MVARDNDNVHARANRAVKAAKLFAVIAAEFAIDAESAPVLAEFFSECGEEVWREVARKAGTKAPSGTTIRFVVGLIRSTARGAA